MLPGVTKSGEHIGGGEYTRPGPLSEDYLSNTIFTIHNEGCNPIFSDTEGRTRGKNERVKETDFFGRWYNPHRHTRGHRLIIETSRRFFLGFGQLSLYLLELRRLRTVVGTLPRILS